MTVPNLPTACSGVELRELTCRDVQAFFDLVCANREHLTRFGDHEDLAASTLESIEAYFADRLDSDLRMGIWQGDELIGRVDLSPVARRTFVLGYWIGSKHMGGGYATAACRALIDHARLALGATEFWAGVKHANLKSAAVVSRLGFTAYQDLPTRTRYRLRYS